MTHIHITYETLFDLLRKERSLEDLQSLDPLFWSHVVTYLTERSEFLKQTSLAEQEKTKLQLSNIKRILKEIYDHRERKIITLARTVIRMQENDFADTKNMLPEEKIFFNEALDLFNKYKKEILLAVCNNKLPSLQSSEHDSLLSAHNLSESAKSKRPSSLHNSFDSPSSAYYTSSSSSEDQSFPYAISNEPDGLEEHFSNDSLDEDDLEQDVSFQEKKTIVDPHEELGKKTASTTPQEYDPESSLKQSSSTSSDNSLEKNDKKEDLLIIKFTMDIPKFVGRDKELFGPFKKDEIVSIPSYVAKILIAKQKAQMVLNA